MSPSCCGVLPTPRPSVVWTRLPDGAVLFCPETEVYYGLNNVGALVWELLSAESATLDELANGVLDAYPDADSSQARGDISELLGELENAGLLLTLEGTLES